MSDNTTNNIIMKQEQKELEEQKIELTCITNDDKDKNKEEKTKESQDTPYLQLQIKIDELIGFYYWKRYIASAFWSNISTPVNLGITLMTAIMTAQATTSNFISENTYYNISIINLLLTTLNTFFRPHQKMTQTLESLSKWNTLGCDFDVIVGMEAITIEQIRKKRDEFNKLLSKVNNHRQSENAEIINFCTDLIHIMARLCCISTTKFWSDEKYKIANNNNYSCCASCEDYCTCSTCCHK